VCLCSLVGALVAAWQQSQRPRSLLGKAFLKINTCFSEKKVHFSTFNFASVFGLFLVFCN